MADRPSLVLVQAVILESLRIATLVPIVGHACARDTVINGYNLPKSTEGNYICFVILNSCRTQLNVFFLSYLQ